MSTSPEYHALFVSPPSGATQGTEIIKTNLKLNVFGVKLNSFFYHSYFPSQSSLTWTLDYTKKSTLGKLHADLSPPFWATARQSGTRAEGWDSSTLSVVTRFS